MTTAAIFDVDGTLTATTGVDDACFVAAIEKVLGVTVLDTDWGNYVHSTDQGLTVEVCTRAGRAAPTAAQIADVKHVFVGLLKEKIGKNKALCVGIEGVGKMLESARARPGWRVGIASGAWAESAAVKLGFAGVRVDDLVKTFSFAKTDGRPAMREEIIMQTVEKLGIARPAAAGWKGARSGPGGVAYIGDGVWDARAAKALGIGFVGVAHGEKKARLEREGVRRVVENHADLATVLRLIEQAAAG